MVAVLLDPVTLYSVKFLEPTCVTLVVLELPICWIITLLSPVAVNVCTRLVNAVLELNGAALPPQQSEGAGAGGGGADDPALG